MLLSGLSQSSSQSTEVVVRTLTQEELACLGAPVNAQIDLFDELPDVDDVEEDPGRER